MQVSDIKASSIEVRMLVSARNAPQTWDLRCFVRERMLGFIQDHCPEALPQTRLLMDTAMTSGNGPTSFDPVGRPTAAMDQIVSTDEHAGIPRGEATKDAPPG